VRPEERLDFSGFGDELGLIFEQRKTPTLMGQPGVELHHDASFLFALVIGSDFFVIGMAELRPEHTVHAGRGLNDVRDVLGLGGFIKILHGFAAELLMLREIEATACGDTLKLLSPEGEFVEDVDGRPGIVSELFGRLTVEFEAIALQPDGFIPLEAFAQPIGVPGFPAPIGLGFSARVVLGERPSCGDLSGR
jgi:hypothetical protein